MKTKRVLSQEVLLCMFIAVLLVVMSLLSSKFLTAYNLLEMTRNFIEVGIIALPMTLIIITGGMDLSIESIIALSAIIFGTAFNATRSVAWASAAAIATGIVSGLFNGWLVGRLKMPPLVVTLATMYIFRGLALGISTGKSYTGYPDSFYFLGQGSIAGIPTQLVIWIAAVIVFAIFLDRTYPGRFLVAMGYNERAASFAGIRVRKMKYFLYGLSGLSGGFAAILFVSRISTAKANAGEGFTFDALTAVVLGGTAITGGKGSIIGTALAMIVIGILRNGLTLARYPKELQSVIIGIVLIASVISSVVQKKK